MESRLGDNLVGDVAVDVRQPEVPARVAVRELRVVQAEQVQDGGVQVVDVHAVFDGMVAVLVRRAVDGARFDASAGRADRTSPV